MSSLRQETRSRRRDANRPSIMLERRMNMPFPQSPADGSLLASLWDSYCSHVRRHQLPLQLVDDLLTRLLFWTPHATTSSPSSPSTTTALLGTTGTTATTTTTDARWREVVYGLISLHRLAMDLALSQHPIDYDQQALILDSYGSTLEPTCTRRHLQQQQHAPPPSLLLSANTIRIALAVTQNVMPTLLELARMHRQSDDDDNSHDHHGQRRQTVCRLWVERVKFVLRMILITSYWKQVHWETTASASEGQDDHHDYDENGDNSSRDAGGQTIIGGLLQNGGMYRVGDAGVNPPTVANAQALQQRRIYVGRRTGRRVTSTAAAAAAATARHGDQHTIHNTNRTLWMRLVVGELLRLCRPLVWARAERDAAAHTSGNSSMQTKLMWKAWIATLLMEVTSSQCLLSGAVCRDNVQSQAELSRRRMKLLLYLLRSPVWDRATEPSLMRIAAILRRLPLVGRFAESYLWEWVLYWKHPFVSEEE